MNYRTWPDRSNAVTREDAPLSKESWILDELVELLTEAAVRRRNPVREFRTPKATLGKEEEE